MRLLVSHYVPRRFVQTKLLTSYRDLFRVRTTALNKNINRHRQTVCARLCERSWGPCKALWGGLGASWRHLGGNRAKKPRGESLVATSVHEQSPLGALLGRSWGDLGRSWPRLRPLLSPSWTSLGPSGGPFQSLKSQSGARKRKC